MLQGQGLASWSTSLWHYIKASGHLWLTLRTLSPEVVSFEAILNPASCHGREECSHCIFRYYKGSQAISRFLAIYTYVIDARIMIMIIHMHVPTIWSTLIIYNTQNIRVYKFSKMIHPPTWFLPWEDIIINMAKSAGRGNISYELV